MKRKSGTILPGIFHRSGSDGDEQMPESRAVHEKEAASAHLDATSGGPASGGAASRGAASGGAASGGAVSGGAVSGGAASGGAASGRAAAVATDAGTGSAVGTSAVAAPADDQAPATTDAPAETEAPAETGGPAETRRPAEAETPAEAGTTAEAGTPAEPAIPSEPATLAEPGEAAGAGDGAEAPAPGGGTVGAGTVAVGRPEVPGVPGGPEKTGEPGTAPEVPPGPATGPGLRNVDRKKLEDSLLDLRRRIVAAPLLLEAPGAADAKEDRWKLLRQIDDYLLPRLRRPAAPVLVALVGSTGAGKSTLVNSIVGKRVSTTGIRRPTTNSPVLACHPDDADWFAENKFLPTLPRVRQEGLARPGRDGLLVLAATEGMPRGIALLDTPDIDSVVRAHYDFAHQFLDASDLWLFMTTAARYADAPAWDLLRLAKERAAALGIVLSRVPGEASTELVAHFTAMLSANGVGANDRFVIPETVVTDGMLPAEVFAPVREWLEAAATSEERREQVLTQTMSGVLDTFRTRVPALAGHVERQVALRAELEELVDGAYGTSLAQLDEATANGSLLHGEVLARWQDFAGTGDLMRTLQARRTRGARKHPRSVVPARLRALKSALRAGLESLIVASGDRAAEEAVTRWRAHAAGAALLASAGETPDGGDTARGGAGAGTSHDAGRDPATALGESSAGLARRASRAVSAWQDHVLHLVQAEGVTKRAVARAVPIDEEALAVVLQFGLLGEDSSEKAQADGASAVPRRLLNSLFGSEALRTVSAKARADLRDRVGLIFDEEIVRFAQVADSVGVPDDTAAVQLYQATYSLETVR